MEKPGDYLPRDIMNIVHDYSIDQRLNYMRVRYQFGKTIAFMLVDRSENLVPLYYSTEKVMGRLKFFMTDPLYTIWHTLASEETMREYETAHSNTLLRLI